MPKPEKRKLLEYKRLAVSAAAAAGANVFRFWTTTKRLLEAVADYVGSFFPADYDWLAHAIIFSTVSLGLYIILWGPVGDFLFENGRKVATRIGVGLRYVTGRKKSVYTEEERTRGEFRRDMVGAIESSNIIYFLLLAGYTMVHEEREKFILEAIFHLTPAQRAAKDIRFLFLSRECRSWNVRAQDMVNQDPELRDVDEYKTLCENAETTIKTMIPKAKLKFYDRLPSWRLHVFDDRLFVSYYSGPPDSKFVSGHLAPAVAYDSDHEMYAWLRSEFIRLWEADEPPRLIP